MDPYAHKAKNHAKPPVVVLQAAIGGHLSPKVSAHAVTNAALAEARAPGRAMTRAVGGAPKAAQHHRDAKRAHVAMLVAKSPDLARNPAPARIDTATGRARYQNAFAKGVFVAPFQRSAHTGIGHGV